MEMQILKWLPRIYENSSMRYKIILGNFLSLLVIILVLFFSAMLWLYQASNIGDMKQNRLKNDALSEISFNLQRVKSSLRAILLETVYENEIEVQRSRKNILDLLKKLRNVLPLLQEMDGDFDVLLHGIQMNLNNHLIYNGVFSFIMLTSVVLISYFFFFYIIEPFNVLLKGINNIEIGEEKEFKINTVSLEAGQLAEAFNQQLKKLREERQLVEVALKQQGVISDLLKLSFELLPIDNLLQEVLNIISESLLFGRDGLKGAIFLANTRSEELNLIASINLSSFILEKCAHLPFGTCICGRVAETKETVFISCESSKHSIRDDTAGLHSHLCLPIISGSTLLGILNIYFAYNQEHNKQDELFLNDIANALVVMIERKLSQGSLITAKKQAEKANLTKSEFIANMSHELRSPLNSIVSTLRLLVGLIEDREAADNADWKEGQQGIVYAQRAANRLMKLIDAVLDISKIESGRMEFNIKPASLEKIVEKACEEMLLQAQAKSLSLHIKKTDIDTVIPVDNIKITQVIINLLSNAIKFTPAGKVIEISITDGFLSGKRKTDNNIPALILEIRDQGVGIPEAETASIFHQFVQSSFTKTGAGGTGLGLSITKAIVLAHDGIIAVSNNLTGGTTFSVTLPRQINHHSS
ncbi:MAG: GAF domain-containing sensor histidine kinase [Candidatus Falkowbacteria bacterium]|nr:GAF domain-containing sensor histidine kinase [Candidatus Falkowbacteria bacterium]